MVGLSSAGSPALPYRTEEYYENHEEKALSVTTKETSFKFTKGTPKHVILFADGADILVDFDESISGDSYKILNTGSLSLALQVKTIYAKTVTGTGTLRILGLW